MTDTTPTLLTETPTQIAKHYSACLDSVALIKGPAPASMPPEVWTEVVARNKEHLVFMLGKTFWTTEDLTTIKDASV